MDSENDFIINPSLMNTDGDSGFLPQADLDMLKVEHSSNEEELEIKFKYNVDKEENLHTGEALDKSIQNIKEEKLDDRLISLPIVFTTRLDDMRIIQEKNYDGSMSLNDFTNNILNESFPKYNNQKPNMKSGSMESYNVLTQKINEMKIINSHKKSAKNNISVSNSPVNVKKVPFFNSTYQGNARLLKMCKPLSIVLEKFDMKDCMVPVPPLRKYRKPKMKFEKNPTYCFIFHESYTNETDIYCIANSILVENYTLNNEGNLSIQSYIKRFKELGIRPEQKMFCCWHRRDAYMNSLEVMINSNIREFMKKSHNCRFSKCTCCCSTVTKKNNNDGTSTLQTVQGNQTKSRTTDDTSIEDIEIKDLENKISDTILGIKPLEHGYKTSWLENILSVAKSSGSNSLVSAALNYSRTLPNLKKEQETNSEICGIYAQGKGEAYSTGNSSFETILSIGQKSSKNEIALLLDSACCWYRREKTISNLYPDATGLARFLKSQHECTLGKCSCCCRPQKTLSLLVNTINRPPIESEPKPVSPITNSTLLMPKIVTSQTIPKSISLSSKASTQNNNDKSKNDKIHPPKYESIVPHDTTPIITPDRRCDNNVVDEQVEKNFADSLITTILDRFKDVRLTINENGNVAAALNAPANTLNTAELKVLANILAHAQKQIKLLGLGPGNSLHNSDMKEPIHNDTQTSIPTSAIESNRNNSEIKALLSKETRPPPISIQPKPKILRNFSTVSQCHNKSLLKSFYSYLGSKKKMSENNLNDETSAVSSGDDTFKLPKISEVFSLHNVYAKKPARNTVNANASKRKIDTEPQRSGKIRVVPPAKLGLPENEESNPQLNSTLPVLPTLTSNSLTEPVESLPKIDTVVGNAAMIPETPANMNSNINNIFAIEPQPPQHSLATGKSGINQMENPLNINTVLQNIPVMPQSDSAFVFHISNLDTMSVAHPGLLKAEPVSQPQQKSRPRHRPRILACPPQGPQVLKRIAPKKPSPPFP